MTPEERAAMTVEQFDAAIVDIINRHPTNRNPVGSDHVCLYTAESDPSQHCLVGQYLAERDPELLPSAGGRENGSPAANLLRAASYGEDVARRASRWQGVADEQDDEAALDQSVTWGEALEERQKRDWEKA